MGCKFFVGDKVFDKEGLKAYLLENNFEQLSAMLKQDKNRQSIRYQIISADSDSKDNSQDGSPFVSHNGYAMSIEGYEEVRNLSDDTLLDFSLSEAERSDKFFEGLRMTSWYNGLSSAQRGTITDRDILILIRKGVGASMSVTQKELKQEEESLRGAVSSSVDRENRQLVTEEPTNDIVDDTTDDLAKIETNKITSKKGEKAVQRRINQSYNDDYLRDIAISTGLYYEVENQQEAYNKAKDILEEVGIEGALDMLDNTTVNHELSHF